MTRPAARPTTYVRTAQRLLRRPGVVSVSAQQVAYVAHRRSWLASQYDLVADDALAASGLFARANMIGSNGLGITLWKLAESR